MTAYEHWAYMDPARILERKQEREARQRERSKQGKAQRARAGLELLFTEGAMTQDQREQMESLLDVWYDYEDRFRMALGAPKVSVSCRDHQPESGDVHTTSQDRDELLERLKAESVAACIDELHYMQRAAINVHMRNKRARVSVHSNPRIEDQHKAYQEAKAALWPLLRRKGLVS